MRCGVFNTAKNRRISVSLIKVQNQLIYEASDITENKLTDCSRNYHREVRMFLQNSYNDQADSGNSVTDTGAGVA